MLVKPKWCLKEIWHCFTYNILIVFICTAICVWHHWKDQWVLVSNRPPSITYTGTIHARFVIPSMLRVSVSVINRHPNSKVAVKVIISVWNIMNDMSRCYSALLPHPSQPISLACFFSRSVSPIWVTPLLSNKITFYSPYLNKKKQ